MYVALMDLFLGKVNMRHLRKLKADPGQIRSPSLSEYPPS